MSFDYQTFQKQAMMRKAYEALRDRNSSHDLLNLVSQDQDGIFTFNQTVLDENSRNGNLPEIRLYAIYAAASRKAVYDEEQRTSQ